MNRSGLIATKLGNTSFYSPDGSSTHVTILKVEDCIVSKVKTVENDGYSAVQLASIDTGKDIDFSDVFDKDAQDEAEEDLEEVNKKEEEVSSSISL